MAVLLAPLAVLSIGDTIANVAVKLDPASAASLTTGDGRITAARAETLFTTGLDASPDSEAARLARLALRQDPTATDALTVLGLQAQLRGRPEETRRIFAYSLELSRRELRPRLWAIEEAVSRGDVRAALRHYDAALRTSRSAPDILFPILAGAIAEPKVRAGLLPILRREPDWAAPFVQFAASRDVEPSAARLLFREGAGFLPVGDFERAALIDALLARDRTDEAWSFYRSFRGDVDRRRSRDPRFGLAADTATAFDWVADTEGSASVSIQGEQDGGFVDFSVPPSTSATLVRQTQLLPPGSYGLTGRASGIDEPEPSRPYWTLVCRDGRELGRIALPPSGEGEAAFSGTFTVPSGCPVQTLQLVARPSDQIAGIEGRIVQLQLGPR